MKKIFNILIALTIVAGSSSCKKFLDINQNPNSALSVTPQLILPQAITAMANQIPSFSNYGGQTVGYYANAGGFSGWGSIITYDYTTTDFQGLWNNMYDNLYDFEYVIEQSEGDSELVYYNAIAKIMKAFGTQMLVDTYNDIPYSEAFQGNKTLSVKYDKAEDVYVAIANLVDEAIAQIKSANESAISIKGKTEDPLFLGDTKQWLKFAQSLKLKIILRADGKANFSNTSFDSEIGFIEDDAIVNPGYVKDEGKQNRLWNSWAYNAAGTAQSFGAQYVPTPFVAAFYNGIKLSDPARGKVLYKAWANSNVPSNQLGYTEGDAVRGGSPNAWFIGTNSNTYSQIGIFKGPDAGQPIMLASSVYFEIAEAKVRGLLSGDPVSDFNNGIESSFKYLYKNASGTIPADRDAHGDAQAYKEANADNPLANLSLASSSEKKIEAIVTQKYIAENMILGHEAWNDFRRTGYPRSVSNPQGNKDDSMVSLTSGSTTENRLPNRILYPETEFKYNSGNVKTINPNSDKIFWAK